ncbi:serine/arginine repetitive matrix protein 1-like [Asterias rubens]|uniref:serine/arginine repetitive matrix protein 1-like n=1 Tax=Asterias rubens TaxID=7604 RepID=UPI001454E913|nr:serine/arginine repetitive matrix protein 1-like [Asterias rubens]XP_033636509.1 serine/arginine repetitive matrix protein 1-like [Asterias rubens]
MGSIGNANEGARGLPTDILKSSPYLTIVILVAGVTGGLALVIGVIFFCKYCVKRRRLPARDPAFFTPLPLDLDLDNRSRLVRLESRSDDIRLPLGEEDGSPERLLGDDEENVDSCIADYLANGDAHSMEHLPDIPEEDPQMIIGEVETSTADFDTDRAVDAEHSPVSPRRVSFQVIPIKQKQAKYVRRFTEGDFHHLKTSRIKPSGDSMKAFSLDYDCHRSMENRNHSSGRSARTSLPTPDDLQWQKPLGADVLLQPRGMTVKAQVHIQPTDENKDPEVKSREPSPGGQPRLHVPTHLQLRSSPRKNREKAADIDRDSESKGFVPIPPENAAGFAEPIGSVCSEGHVKNTKGQRRGPGGAPRFHPPPQIEICEKPTPDKERRTGDYRELWQLRTTLEMEDTGSLSSEPDTVIPVEEVKSEASAPEGDGDSSQYLEPSDSALSPTDTSAAEADDGKNRLTVVQRYKFNTHGKNDSFEQMFSSISTEESDTSERSKGGDSSGKDSASKLKQMQADSGYTSIEHKNEVSEQQKRYLFASADRDSTSLESCAPALSSESSPIGERPTSSGTDSAVLTESGKEEPLPNIHGVRRRSDRRTASTKRREFIAEKGEAIFGSFSFPEEESEADSQTITGSISASEKSIGIASDSQGDSPERLRGANRVGRIFRIQGENRLRVYPKGRDYSIDEKTDALFKEFMRSDALFDAPSSRRSRPPRGRRLQLHHKQHSDSVVEPTRKMEVPSTSDGRSASFDHRGESAKERLTHLLPGNSSGRKLSPQDSLEEEYLRKESNKIWGQGQPPTRKRDPDDKPSRDHEPPPSRHELPPGRHEPPPGRHEPPPGRHEPPPGRHEPPPGRHEPPPGRHEPPPGRHEHIGEARGSAQVSQRLELEDVSCRPSAFRCVKKSPKLKRSHASMGPEDEGSLDKPRAHDEQAPLSKGKIISQTTLVRPTAIHPKESLPSHGGAGHRECPRIGGHHSSKGDLRDEGYRHREPHPSGGSEPHIHRRGRSPGRDRSPWRSPQTPTATHSQEGETPYSDRRAKSPLRMHSAGSSQGSAEWSDDRGFLGVPPKGHLDRPHSASSLLRLQREAASPQFERHYSDETYDAPRHNRSIDYDSKCESERDHRGSSGRLHPLRYPPGRHIRPTTVRTSSETNILETRDGHKRNRAHDLRRQHYGRAHSALDVFAGNKLPPKEPIVKQRPTPERLSVRSMTVDSPTSPSAASKERRHPLDVLKDERKHPLEGLREDRRYHLDSQKEDRKHPLDCLKDDRKSSKEERKHPLEGYKEKFKDSKAAPLRW